MPVRIVGESLGRLSAFTCIAIEPSGVDSYPMGSLIVVVVERTTRIGRKRSRREVYPSRMAVIQWLGDDIDDCRGGVVP